jgi:hypothetical protein
LSQKCIGHCGMICRIVLRPLEHTSLVALKAGGLTTYTVQPGQGLGQTLDAAVVWPLTFKARYLFFPSAVLHHSLQRIPLSHLHANANLLRPLSRVSKATEVLTVALSVPCKFSPLFRFLVSYRKSLFQALNTATHRSGTWRS